MKMTDFVRKPFGLGAKNNVLRVLRKIESFVMKILYPNITGEARFVRYNADKIGTIVKNQALSVSVDNKNTAIPSGGTTGSCGLLLNAYDANSLYNSNTIQLPSLRIRTLVRI